VLHDERNQCANVNLVRGDLSWMTLIVSVTSVSLGQALQALILLHFIETTPSILRCSAITLLYIPMMSLVNFENLIY
ncbi:hypothetical protein PFISCL1PPCAC_5340, partial [Pristionchus fissidentatus]